VKRNVGDLDAYLRLTVGLTAFGYGIIRSSRLSVLFGSMKIAEGLIRWCPTSALLGISTVGEERTIKEMKCGCEETFEET